MEIASRYFRDGWVLRLTEQRRTEKIADGETRDNCSAGRPVEGSEKGHENASMVKGATASSTAPWGHCAERLHCH